MPTTRSSALACGVLAEELAERPADALDALRLTLAFAEGWSGPLAPHDGVPLEEVRAAEDRLGIGVPAPLRDVLLHVGRRRSIVAAQDPLVQPQQWRLEEDGLLPVRQEAQGCVLWAVPVHGGEDPPVLVRDPGDPRSSWQPYMDRLSEFLLESVVFEWSMSAEHAASRQIEDDEIPRLRTSYGTILSPHRSWFGPGLIEWFAGEDVLLRLDAATWLWVAARTSEALRETTSRLGGDWLP